MRSRRQVAAVFAFVAVVALVVSQIRDSKVADAGAAVGGAVASLRGATTARDARPYDGYGAWVDAFDYGPSGRSALTPAVVDDMAAHGVKTLYLQASRRSGLIDRVLVAEFLVRAHHAGLRVVAWYLPTFDSVDADVANVEQLLAFEVDGNRFDGVAIDIEDTDTVTDVDARNRNLVEFSERVRVAAGDDAVGAIVLPPVLTEVVNQNFWPDFPWHDIGPLYDVWLPMSYWTLRTSASGYRDGYTYNDESVRRLRSNLGDPNAIVHGIGGIGDEMTVADVDRFASSLVDNRAIGGSIYDWNSMTPAMRDAVTARLGKG